MHLQANPITGRIIWFGGPIKGGAASTVLGVAGAGACAIFAAGCYTGTSFHEHQRALKKKEAKRAKKLVKRVVRRVMGDARFTQAFSVYMADAQP